MSKLVIADTVESKLKEIDFRGLSMLSTTIPTLMLTSGDWSATIELRTEVRGYTNDKVITNLKALEWLANVDDSDHPSMGLLYGEYQYRIVNPSVKSISMASDESATFFKIVFKIVLSYEKVELIT